MRTTAVLIGVGWVGLAALVAEAATARPLPLALRAALLAVVALAIGVGLVRRATRGFTAIATLWCAGLLLGLGLPLLARPQSVDAWQTAGETRFRARFATVRSRLLEIEAMARALGDSAYTLVADSAAAPSPPEERARLFARLEAYIAASRRTGPRDLPLEPGVQLFGAHGELVAWAGSVHAEETSTLLAHFLRGPRQVYFERAGVFTLLDYDRQDGREASAAAGTSRAGPRVRVELPVAVEYRLRNRLLPDWSLAEELSGGGVEVDLLYEASLIPPYLTQNDIEIFRDPQRGMQAQFVVRGDEGVPRLVGRLGGPPQPDSAAADRARERHLQAWLAVLGALLGLAALVVAAGSRARRLPAWGAPVVAILGLGCVRLLLAVLGLPRGDLRGPSSLDPALFALSGMAGVLRSPFDLLLTTLALLGAAGILFLHAVRHEWRRAPGSSGATAWRVAAGVVLAAALAWGVVRLGLEGVGRVLANTTPRLAGPGLDLFSLPVLCIHAGLLAGLAALLVLGLLAISVLVPRRCAQGVVIAAAVAVAAGLWQTSALAALVGFAVFLSGARLHRLLADERFTSFGLAAFALVALCATLVHVAVHNDALHRRQELVLQRAAGVYRLVDDVRPFVLERVLRDVQSDADVQRRLTSGRDPDRSSLAFDIWTGSMLPRLGWSCQVRVVDEFGALSSEFSIGMPYGGDTPTREQQERARLEGLHVEQIEVQATPVGSVRAYRGAVPIRAIAGGRVRGTVVVDLPFGHESLVAAAGRATGQPELLRAAEPDGMGAEESQRYLLAWLEKGAVVESSTPNLEVGKELGTPASGSAWERLRLANDTWLVTRIPVGDRVLLAGFPLLGPVDRLLEWTQVASFDFAVTLVLLLVHVGIGRMRGLGRRMPPLLVPKRVGFQQKLMGAFLVVALIPSVVLSLATRDIIRERSLSRNRDATLEKARSAEAALTDLVRRETQTVRNSDYLLEVLRHEEMHQVETLPVRDIGQFGDLNYLMVFHGDGRIILDETLSNLSDADARRFVGGSAGGVFAARDETGSLNLGLLVPVWFSLREGLSESAPDAQLYWLYFRRRITDGLLRDLASIVNADISGFLGPRLVVSSQKSLATAGLLPAFLPPAAFAHVELHRNPWAVIEQRSGLQRYLAGYLPLEDRYGTRIGALAVSQLLQPDEVAVEVERTRALVVGLSTFMFVLTLLLGVVFAGRIFDPIRSLIEGTRRLAGGEFGFRLRARAGDEIGELERSFNDMAARLHGARSALEERHRYLEAVLGNIASGVVTTDENGRITAANAAAHRILRLSAASLTGRSWRELAAGAGDPGTQRFWTQIGASADGEEVEVTTLTADAPLVLRLIVTDLRPEPGAAPLGRVAIFEDISELIRSKKLAAWAEMARQVAHEIKNPLTPLKASAQFVEQAYRDRSERFPEIFAEGMRTIVQQVDVLRRIASEFSGFGRVQKLEPRPLDLGLLLQRVTAPYRNLPGIVLDFADGGGNDTPGSGVRILGDEEGLRKVFTNVLENAREAMGGQGRIQLAVEPVPGGHVQVLVTDEGTGLAEEARHRLFEPYFSTKTTGTGLGLAISRSILEELGGSITLSNRPLGGAEVRIVLATC